MKWNGSKFKAVQGISITSANVQALISKWPSFPSLYRRSPCAPTELFPGINFASPTYSENVFSIYDRYFRAHFSPSQYGSVSLIVSCGNSEPSVGVHIVKNDKTEPEARKYAQGATLQPLTWLTSMSRHVDWPQAEHKSVKTEIQLAPEMYILQFDHQV